MSTKTTKALQETQIERGVPPSKTISVATASSTRWSGKQVSARRNNIIMDDVDKSFNGKAQVDYEQTRARNVISQQRLAAAMDEPGGTDDLEEEDDDETQPSRVDDPDAVLTIGEIMEIEVRPSSFLEWLHVGTDFACLLCS